MDSGSLPATYTPQAIVGSNRTLVNEFYLITLSNITTTTEGRVYTSTATTAVPVNISHNGMNLTCTDSSDLNTVSTNISIHININIIKSKYTQ